MLTLLAVSAYTSKQLKKGHIFIFSLILILISLILLPKTTGEGTNLQRTSTILAKIRNYQQAIHLFIKQPILGHGYNFLPQAKQQSNYYQPQSHSNSAFDSSLLTILTSTGLVSFSLFLIAIIKEFKQDSLLKKNLYLAIFVHSLFANSMLYPWVIISLLFLST